MTQSNASGPEFGRGSGRSTPAQSAAIKSVAVLTHNRPKELRRTLLSVGEVIRSYGHSVALCVTDSSQDEGITAANKQSLRDVGREYSLDTRYIGRAEKLQLVRTLGDHGIPALVSRFAFFGLEHAENIGANRNAELIDNVGDAFISFDDDVIALASCLTSAKSSASFTSDLNFMTFRPAAKRGVLLQDVKFEVLDLVGTHGRVLGRSVSELSMLFDASKSEQDDCRLKMKSCDGRVAISMMGLVGDSGLASPLSYYLVGKVDLSGVSSFVRMFTLASREVARFVEETVITDLPWCLGASIGLDASRGIVPFMPSFRNEDGLFAFMLRFLSETKYFAHLPFVHLHDPPTERRYNMTGLINGTLKFAFFNVVIAAMQVARPTLTGDSFDMRMIQLGRFFVSLSQIPLAEFVECVEKEMRTASLSYLKKLESAARGADRFGRGMIVLYMKSLESRLRQGSLLDLSDLGASASKSSSEAAQEVVGQFGLLLQWWPSILQCALERKASGLGIGQHCSA